MEGAVPSLADLLATLRSSLTAPTTAAASLPDKSDLAFERSLSRPLGKRLDAESDRVLALVSNLIKWVDPVANKSWEADGDMIREGEYRDITERVEGLLEAADDGIEKHLGVGKARAGVGAVGAKPDSGSRTPSRGGKGGKDRLAPHLLHDPNVAKPQLSFPQRLVVPIPPLAPATKAYDPNAPPVWKPVLRQKLNAKSASDPWLLVESYTPPPPKTPTHSVSITPTPDPAHPRLRYAHPYAAELATLTPPASFFDLPAAAPEKPTPKSFDEVPFEWVGDKIGLMKMLGEIREVGKGGQKELAVDLEHHDFRSWAGLTCLIQLSTRKKDYVIDALDPAVRDDLELLNEFFTDPSWIKVFHGAHSDIIWLQRDFGLYVIGLFDTYHATHVLGHARHGLANLLEMYSDFEADKRYQLADWRIRPVPKEMLHYARSDTHYLLDIYDHLRLALSTFTPPTVPEFDDFDQPITPIVEAETSAPATMDVDPPSPTQYLSTVFERSIGTSSGVFEMIPYDHQTGLSDGGWKSLLFKWRHARDYETAVAVPTLPMKTGWGPGEIHFEVLKGLHAWREGVAREEDESPRFIIGNEGLERLVESTPETEEEVIRTVGGGRGNVGEILRKRKTEVVQVVKDALARITVGVGRKSTTEEEIRALITGERGEAALEPAVRPVAGLWDAGLPDLDPAVVKTASSSFFGSSAKVSPTPVVHKSTVAAGSSSFFGGSKAKVQAAAVTSTPNSREDAVARVHASLVLGGGLANSLRAHAIPTAVAPTPVETPAESADSIPLDDQPASMDHAYVPLSGRIGREAPLFASSSKPLPAVPSAKDSDVLIVSALADKPKKRRRPKVEVEVDPLEAGMSDQSTPQKKQKKKEKAVVVPLERLAPHDYASSKSILDLDPEAARALDATAGGKKRKPKNDGEPRKQKGFEVDTSDFRRQPRVNNASKKGNVSQSFAK
ncbi:exosome complex exonuclease RRP6, partial [Phenoliferia sp. Uapishka_3]